MIPNVRQLGLGKLKVKSSLMILRIDQSAWLAIGFAVSTTNGEQIVTHS